jgi:catechol 2,3-dioxygenase-like lactoylglutathione lyase family enzyme
MLGESKAYSGFAVKDLGEAKEFYGGTLGVKMEVLDEENGLAQLEHGDGKVTLCYEQADSTPASYTMLNFQVDDIDAAVDELSSKGVSFERYDDFPFEQDEKGIARGLAANQGPDIAWFKDPSGNVLSVLQES